MNNLKITVYIFLIFLIFGNSLSWIAYPNFLTFNIATSIALVSAFLTLVILDYNKIKNILNHYSPAKILKMILNFCLILGILGLINYLSFKNPIQFDLSKGKISSLSFESREILKGLTQKTVFKIFTRLEYRESLESIAEIFRLENSNISIEYVDIEIRPDLVNQYNILEERTLIIEQGEKSIPITEITELKIINALNKIINKDETRICFSEGHGEANFSNTEKTGYSKALIALAKIGYKTSDFLLPAAKSVPSSCDVLVIWSPKFDFKENEIAMIEDYLSQSGQLIVSLDPMSSGDKVLFFRSFLKRYGISIANNYLIDKKNFINGSNGSIPVFYDLPQGHNLLKNLEGPIFFPLASEITLSANTGYDVFPILKTSDFPSGWGEFNVSEIIAGNFTYSEGIDTKGPNIVMALIEKEREEQTNMMIAAFGNSTFIQNAYVNLANNIELFKNTISYVSANNQLISLNLDSNQSMVSLNSLNKSIIFYFSTIFSTLSFLILSFIFYKKRSKL